MNDDNFEYDDREDNELFEKVVRAGKRTYFFDVRSTRNKDYYLTITESKKRFNHDGTASYQKHKIFLYKEDFEKFGEALAESFQKIIELRQEQDDTEANSLSQRLSDIRFEDLDDHNKLD